MKIWFDTEFIEDGKTIDLVSIGMVREDGEELYMQNADCDLSRADAWVRDNVIAKLGPVYDTRASMRARVLAFAGERPEFWAYYADYDWVVLCQLFGRMIDLPRGWPMYCRDLKQELDHENLRAPTSCDAHNALEDARWVKSTHLWLTQGATR